MTSRNDYLDNAIKITNWLHTLGKRTFCIEDIQDVLGCHRRTAERWLDALSRTMPICQVRGSLPVPGCMGRIPALYRHDK